MQKELFPVMEHRYDNKNEPERWGYIDRAGRLAIDCRFDHAGEFHDGVARVVLPAAQRISTRTGHRP